MQVRKLCMELLINYPSQQFVTTILHTLTQLAAATITDLTDQVSFLLTYMNDARPEVRISVLRDLKFLGEKGGHLWEPNHISTLMDSRIKDRRALEENDDAMEVDDDNNEEPAVNLLLEAQIIHTTLDVIDSVTSSSAILPFLQSPGKRK